MNCWICGSTGTSGEHLIKASDVRQYFPDISQHSPLYISTDNKRNIPVGTSKSDRFKSSALICKECNSYRTQRYDKAWELLSIYMKNNWGKITTEGEMNLSDIFRNANRYQPLDAYLYFVKIFGCRIVEHNVPINISCFSKALLERCPHKDIYLAFGSNPENKHSKYVGMTLIDSQNLNGIPAYVNWFHVLDQIAINIIYSPTGDCNETVGPVWHPLYESGIVKLNHWERWAENCP